MAVSVNVRKLPFDKQCTLNKTPVITGNIERGLIIDEPWVGKILSGEKIWEIRSTRVKKVGPIALVKKGTKTIVGVADLEGSEGPLSFDQLENTHNKHRIPKGIYTEEGYKWFYAWKLNNIERLAQPIPYKHKSGSVIWVKLDASAISALDEVLVRSNQSLPNFELASIGDMKAQSSRPSTRKIASHSIPIARDGSRFTKNVINNKGMYTVGEKGNELKFSSYDEALGYLRHM